MLFGAAIAGFPNAGIMPLIPGGVAWSGADTERNGDHSLRYSTPNPTPLGVLFAVRWGPTERRMPDVPEIVPPSR